ncbi:acyltransferase family protein [Staphylococcus borealis]|uniref:acyltransferase family protein n=1 Tax=Staphylococcus borealis TaxID=2742203 RepID=UPI0025A2BDD4|nr:acyltransferase family protein [Staphylococcus borealis]MDM7864519.1 acyltransferase family protein [Staphylococcus borealis]
MKKFIPVIFWMRSISCLGVVLIHSISITLGQNSNLEKNEWPTYVQIFLMFSTPTFVFITEFLNAYIYGGKLKKGFFKKRLLFLGLPYIFLNIFWTFSYHNPKSIMEFIDGFVLVSIRGYSVTYFIVIIFQFYILHMLFGEVLKKVKPLPIITASIIITSIYWGIRLILPAPDNFIGYIIWGKEGQTLFFGWITYFLLGYYIGIYYDVFISKIQEYKYYIIGLFIISIIIVLLTHNLGINSAIGSKRLDTPIYTTSVILMFFLVNSYFKYIPKFILFISNYSFSVYLLHLVFLNRMTVLSDSIFEDIVYKFIIALVASICIAYIVNLSRFGKYLVGNVVKLEHKSLN